MLRFAALFYLVSLLAPARAFWIVSHSPLVQDRLDPLVFPGRVGGHVHSIVGSSDFGPNSTFESLRADKNCTTAPVQADMSLYWAPQLYYQNHTDKTFTLVPTSYAQTYYLQRPDSRQKGVKAFPPGFQMVAGSPFRATYNESNQADRAINFVCLNFKGKSTESRGFPDVQCPDGLRAQIVFPSCWDGENLDSKDHVSHVSYPLGTSPDNGDCPGSHPVKLITLFYEFIFDVAKFDFVPGTKNFVFSTGDETGLTFHADFINGWDVDVLQAAADLCTGDLFGDLEKCPPFIPTIDRDKASSCTIARAVEEEIDGPLTVLPGCNPVPFNGTKPTCPNLETPPIKERTKESDTPVHGTTVAVDLDASINLRMVKRHKKLHRSPINAF